MILLLMPFATKMEGRNERENNQKRGDYYSFFCKIEIKGGWMEWVGEGFSLQEDAL